MTAYQDRIFEHYRDSYDWPWQRQRVIGDVSFTNCTFASLSLSVGGTPNRRTVVRNVSIEHCAIGWAHVWPAIFESCSVNGLKATGQVLVHGSVYRHVMLEGNITSVSLFCLPPKQHSMATDAEWNSANIEYYKGVDWALDISNLRARDIDLRGVPGNLVRRDRRSQAYLTREEALRRRWDSDEFSNDWRFAIDQYLRQTPWDGFVLAAAKRARTFNDELIGLQRLRDAGIVEMD